MKKQVLGVKVDDLSLDKIVNTVLEWINKSGKHYIVTTNPEFIVKAQEDEAFKRILNNADLSIPDGVGLRFAGVKNTSPGTDLMEKLIGESSEKGFTIGFLGGGNEVAEKLTNCLKQRYQTISITISEGGGKIDENGDSVGSKKNKIPKTDILFIAYGHPKQEKWIAKNLRRIPVKVAIGVGGAFDYLSGNLPRAPKFLRRLGFEWLFRLIVQPWRIKRQMGLLKYLLMLVVKKV